MTREQITTAFRTLYSERLELVREYSAHRNEIEAIQLRLDEIARQDELLKQELATLIAHGHVRVRNARSLTLATLAPHPTT